MSIANFIIGFIASAILVAIDFIIYHWLEWIWAMPTAVASVGTVWGFFVMIPVFIIFIALTISVALWVVNEALTP